MLNNYYEYTYSRSLCSVVCKWNYDAFNNNWSSDLLGQIGLSELVDEGNRIGEDVRAPGYPIPGGLNDRAAKELYLLPGTPVGVSMIDAHAGAVALFGCSAEGLDNDVTSKLGNLYTMYTRSLFKHIFDCPLALICGTSSCHMSIVRSPIYVDGVWGPYNGALFPNTFLHEAGQSATGKLLDHVVESHPAYKQLLELAEDIHPHIYLNQQLHRLAVKGGRNVAELTHDFHVWPDYHGNRSPLADPKMRGMVRTIFKYAIKNA